MQVRSFKALVPHSDLSQKIASVPYDVVDTKEVKSLIEDNPYSFLRIIRAEAEFPINFDPYDDAVYKKAKDNFLFMQSKGFLVREPEPCIYIYRQIFENHIQIGITLTCNIDDYENNVIKKHEKTRLAKENDRTRLTSELSANTGPVFLTYKDNEEINKFVNNWIESNEPSINFKDVSNFTHTVWRVLDKDAKEVLELFEKEVSCSYVADGHHRSASAVRVAKERRDKNENHNGSEDYNWFMSVLFPASQLKILSYNRVVKTLSGFSPEEFIDKLSEFFDIKYDNLKSPPHSNSICVYLNGKWFTIYWNEVSDDLIKSLDVSILQDKVIDNILGIKNPREDSRINFVGGIKGTDELESLVDSNDWEIAFSMYPITIDQLINISESGNIMPPKSTWFEPKLRSGLFVHTF